MVFEMPVLLSQITFTLITLATTYLIRYTNQDPNPPKSEPAEKSPANYYATDTTKKDTLMAAGFYLTPAKHINAITLVGIAHALLALPPEAQRVALCPNYNNAPRSGTVFAWNLYTTFTLALLWASLLLRLAAYSNLGSSFTYFITKPSSGLKTTGVHRSIRHPSYTGLFGITLGMVLLFFRARGLIGCWLPAPVAYLLEGLFWVWGVFLVPGVFWVRVREEEAFLAEEFGEEWAAYVARTWRFAPGLI
ncbi:hypothetical protein BJY01DRAFT_245158 [Aspergillus pseudoustus]|uniref:Protein-S-isoprenylcysteine O-methyltransferase n=1 Tax=Aspergillus pseudoustus TaxID=1810923 RepID=A0ABR4KFL1_9EURO